MAWLTHRLPVSEAEAAWLEESASWLRSEFDDRLHEPVLVWTQRDFPIIDTMSDGGAHEAFNIVARRMGVHCGSVRLELPDLSGFDDQSYRWKGSLRHWTTAHPHTDEDDRPTIRIDRTPPMSPERMIAIMAYELADLRLLGENRIDPRRSDREALTDLATVYLGLGVFTANAACEESASGPLRTSRRFGALPDSMYGYGLARFALDRGETKPAWARRLDSRPRTCLRQSLRHLRRTT
jgi:hypothetical protein